VSRYRRLLGYALPYWRGWILIVAVTLLGTAVALLQPWPMQILIDHVLGDEPLPELLARSVALLSGTASGEAISPPSREALLLWVVLAELAVFGITSAVNVLLTRSWILVGQRMVYDLAQDLFAQLQRRSLLFHSRHPVGDSISRVASDSWSIYAAADQLLLTPAHALVTVGAMLVVMARLDVGLTVLALVAAPFMAVSSALLGRPIHAASRAKRDVEGSIKAHVQQTLSGVSVVQAFTQEERQHHRFQEFAAQAIQAHKRTTLAGGLYTLSAGTIGTLGTAAILWIGAGHVLEGRLSVGVILVFLSYVGVLQEQLKALAGIYSTVQESRGGMDRVMEVLEAEREVTDRAGAVPLVMERGLVRLENVTFGYDPGQPVLRDVCFEARPGQTVAIVGPTGAGKSTLVSLVPRFFDPWAGRVTVDGCDVRDVQLKSLRRQVALVLQEAFLFPLTIAENIAYGRPEASRAEIEAAAQAANAHAFIERLPAGYETLVGERGATLSGGERQRLAIARALLKDAPILILDEPTSALDAETEGLLLEALERLMRGRTTLLIAHRLSTIRGADWIVALQGGRLVEAGTHAELLARDGLYARFQRLQTTRPASSRRPAASVAG
jgi:ATP-binding cassette subfamily B protein/subfamily B ATP-binding cassette protein MsbA